MLRNKRNAANDLKYCSCVCVCVCVGGGGGGWRGRGEEKSKKYWPKHFASRWNIKEVQYSVINLRRFTERTNGNCWVWTQGTYYFIFKHGFQLACSEDILSGFHPITLVVLVGLCFLFFALNIKLKKSQTQKFAGRLFKASSLRNFSYTIKRRSQAWWRHHSNTHRLSIEDE